MKLPQTSLLLILVLLQGAALEAFSPYENYIQSTKPKQVGLLAKLPSGEETAFKKAIQQLSESNNQATLLQSGIHNVTAFTRPIGEDIWVVVHFVLDGDRDYLDAARLFENASGCSRALTDRVDPHPRAARFGTKWLQMEWINYIRGKDIAGPATHQIMIVTTVIPDKESAYRSLHQTVWPGVVDQLTRSGNRDLCIFLVDIDDLLVEFLYVEYVGTDQQKDDAMSQSDVINHRWWHLTDACQKGLPGVEGNWVEMSPLQ